MARSIDAIQAQIIEEVSKQPELAQLSSTSKRAIWRLWTFVVAVCINVLEQLMDVFRADMEKIAEQAVPGTPSWLQAQVFRFQYSEQSPYVVQLVNLVPQYLVPDPAARIITRCAIRTDVANSVTVKVAKGDPPQALSPDELNSLQSYVNTIGYAGITYNVSSLSADRVYVAADVFFEGQYASVIRTNVQDAIGGYFANLPFDGTIRMADLEIAIRTVRGVSDVVLKQVRARKEADTFEAGTDLVLNQQLIARLWRTVAGYVVAEDLPGYTLAESLNFIAE